MSPEPAPSPPTRPLSTPIGPSPPSTVRRRWPSPARLVVRLVVVLSLLATSVSAQELVTDRPDFTESALTVAPGRVQVEAGAGREEAGEEVAVTVGEVLLRIGVAERLELRLAPGSWERTEPGAGRAVEGWGDSSLGLKLSLPELSVLFPGAARPDAALLVDAELPTGEGSVGEEGVRPGAILALGWEAAPRLGVGVNLGYRRARSAGERFDQASASMAAGWAAAERLSLFAEWFALSRLEPGGDAAHHLDGGVTWLLGDDLQLDAYVGFGLGDPAPDHFGGVGFAARF